MNTPDSTSTLCPWPWLVALVAASSCLFGGCDYVEERIAIADVPEEDISKAGDSSLPVVCEGARVTVRSTSPHRPAAERCLAIIDKALPILDELLQYKLPPGEKLVVNLYVTKEEYGAAVEAAGCGALREYPGCTAFKTKESYLVIRPRAEPAFLDLVGGLPERTEFNVCHEIVHQLVYRANASNYQLWPDWYAEGMADALAGRCLNEIRPTQRPASIALDTRLIGARDFREEHGSLGFSRILASASLGPGVTERQAFGFHNALYGHLASDEKKIRELSQAIGRLGAPDMPGAGLPDNRPNVLAASCMKELEGVYGPLDKLQNTWEEHLDRQRPSWYEHGWCAEHVGDEIVCAAIPGKSANVITETPAPQSGFVLEGELNFPGIGNLRQAELWAGFDRKSEMRLLIIVGSNPREGFATLVAFSDGAWRDELRENAAVPPELFVNDAWVQFRLEVTKDRILLDLTKKRVAEFHIPAGFGATLGRWGIGASDCVVRFRNLKAR